MCFVWISKQTEIISLYSINRLAFVIKTLCFLWSRKLIFRHYFKDPQGQTCCVQPIPVRFCVANYVFGQQWPAHKRNRPTIRLLCKERLCGRCEPTWDRTRQDCAQQHVTLSCYHSSFGVPERKPAPVSLSPSRFPRELPWIEPGPPHTMLDACLWVLHAPSIWSYLSW